MKLKLAVIFLVVAALAGAQVTGYVESFNIVTKSGTVSLLDLYARGPLKGPVGWSIWVQSSKGWGQAYFGPTFTPAKWISLSTGAGFETDNSVRLGHSLWLGSGRWSFLTIHECGDKYWFRHLGTYQVNKTVAMGINSTRPVGTGPYIEKSFGKITFWGTYAVGANKGIAGAKFNF